MKNPAERPIVKASKSKATELDRVAREESAVMDAEGNKRAADDKAASEASRTQAEKLRTPRASWAAMRTMIGLKACCVSWQSLRITLAKSRLGILYHD